MSLPSHGKHALYVIVSLSLAAMACGSAYDADSLSGAGTGSNAYYVCKTATPVPTVTVVTGERTATPNALGTPSSGSDIDWEWSTPVPTETPYYRTGGFYENQGAIIGGKWEVVLRGGFAAGAGSVLTFELVNHSGEPSTVPLSVLALVTDSEGNPHSYSSELQAALSLANAYEQDGIRITGALTRSLAFDVPFDQIGGISVQTGLLTNGGSRAVFFNLGTDPLVMSAGACAHGPADWLSGEYGGNSAGIPGVTLTDSVAPPNAPGQYAVRPNVRGANYPIPDPFYFASPFMVGGHHGIDLTPCFQAGCPASPTDNLIRMGNTNPIRAVMGGIVQYAGCNWNYGYGCLVIIRTKIGPDDFLYSYYAHMWGAGGSSWRSGVADPTCDPRDCGRTTASAMGVGPGPLVSSGQEVDCGQNIGFVGMSGQTSGPHLHWEVRRGPLRPAPYTPTINAQVDPEETRTYWGASCIVGVGGGH